MENDFIPGNTPQGNRTTLYSSSSSSAPSPIATHLLFLNRSKRLFTILYIFVLMIHTCMKDWSNLGDVTVGISVCVYINKCVIRFHWHYPTQRDNNVTFLTTLCILLECCALCQDARACSSWNRPTCFYYSLQTKWTRTQLKLVVLIIGCCVWKTTLQEDHSGHNLGKILLEKMCMPKTTYGTSGKLSY